MATGDQLQPQLALAQTRLSGDEHRGIDLGDSKRQLGQTARELGLADDEAGHALGPAAVGGQIGRPVQPRRGLGQAIRQKLVQAMGGEITVRSVLGIGTTFEIAVDMPYSTEALSAVA